VNASFFARTAMDGTVTEVVWSKPISLAVPYVTNVHNIFDDDNRERFDHSFSHAVEHPERVVCEHVQIGHESIELCFYLMRTGSAVWVLALDYPYLLDEHIRDSHNQMVFNMLKHCAALNERHHEQTSQEVANNFAQVQKLNNDLMNTHRQLQRAKRQLEVLNEELNNRLVKDPLTHLVSRYQYRSEIARVIEAEPSSLGVFAFIDIDEFKQVNDKHGHAAGDAYLVEFAKRLSNLDFGLPAIRMRIAGDEFGLYVHGVNDVDSFISGFWERFVQSVTTIPIPIDDDCVPISCSVGLAVYNQDTANVFELIEYADKAMYQAKQSGKNAFRLYRRQLS